MKYNEIGIAYQKLWKEINFYRFAYSLIRSVQIPIDSGNSSIVHQDGNRSNISLYLWNKVLLIASELTLL